jgi:hypothetical protein
VRPQRDIGKRVFYYVAALLLAFYAGYGLHHDLILFFGRAPSPPYHGTAARFLAVVFYCLSAKWALVAIRGSEHHREENYVLDTLEKYIVHAAIFCMILAALTAAFSPREKPVFHPGDLVVHPDP